MMISTTTGKLSASSLPQRAAAAAVCLELLLITGGLSQAAAETSEANSPLGSPPAASSRDDQSTPARSLEEVVVTAQKRNERAQDVPTSLVVLPADELLRRGATALVDYASEVPGLSLIGASTPGEGQLVLRGIATGGSSHPLVGIYLDEVPFTPSSPNSDTQSTSFGGSTAFDPDLGEIERIEVLKGPQSTLYGAATMGGLVKFVTKQPSLNDFEARAHVDGSIVDGGGSGYGVRGSVSIPVVMDTLGIRATGFYRHDPGYVDNVFKGITNINEDHVEGARVSARAKFSDNLEMTLSGLVQHTSSNGPNLVYVDPKTLQPSLGGLTYSSPISQPADIKNYSLNFTTTLTMHFATLTNVAGYAESTIDSTEDVSSFAAFVNAPPDLPVALFGPRRSQRFLDELRLASSPGRLEWLLGGFYTHEKDPDDLSIRGTDSEGVILPPSSPFYNVYSYHNVSYFIEKAVFGDLTYRLTERLDGTVGARYSSNNQSFHVQSNGLFGVYDIPGNSSDSAETYLATIRYKPEATLMLYARAASGYRPGGPNIVSPIQVAAGAPSTFGPDKLWNYEAGLKGSLWGERIKYSADAYHMDWKDMQLNVIIHGGTVVVNASSAKSDGVEASLQFAPIDGLVASINGAYIDAKLTAPIGNPVNVADGARLPYAPKVSVSAIVDYRFGGLKGVVPRVGLTYAYHGAQNTALTTSGQGFTLPSYGTLDLRAGLDWSRYSINARIDNVTNRFALTDAVLTSAFQPSGSPVGGVVVKPRTVGLSLEARY
jgi:outer membrane receptor protein involved in Fe transport